MEAHSNLLASEQAGSCTVSAVFVDVDGSIVCSLQAMQQLLQGNKSR